jgi:uncharacterized protein (DUF924 family)
MNKKWMEQQEVRRKGTRPLGARTTTPARAHHSAGVSQDQRALTLALQGIERGHYATLATPWEKTFFFLPLGHSEELRHHEVAVKLAEELVEHAPVELRRI